MAKKKKVQNTDIVQLFSEYSLSGRFGGIWSSIHNPIYSTLAEQFKISKQEIYKAVREMQPSLILKKIK